MHKGFSFTKKDKSSKDKTGNRQEESYKKHVERVGQGQSQGQMDPGIRSRAAEPGRGHDWSSTTQGSRQGGFNSTGTNVDPLRSPAYGNSAATSPSCRPQYAAGSGHHQPLPPIVNHPQTTRTTVRPEDRGTTAADLVNYQLQSSEHQRERYGQNSAFQGRVTQPYNSSRYSDPSWSHGSSGSGNWQTHGITDTAESRNRTDMPDVHQWSGTEREVGWREVPVIPEKSRLPGEKADQEMYLMSAETYNSVVETPASYASTEYGNRKNYIDEPMEVDDTKNYEKPRKPGFPERRSSTYDNENQRRSEDRELARKGRSEDLQDEEASYFGTKQRNLSSSESHHKRDVRSSMERSLSTSGAGNELMDFEHCSEFYNCSDKLEFIKMNCKKDSAPEPPIHQAKLKMTFRDKENGIRKLEFGKKNKSKSEKVIMLVGGTGSGKSTMINAIFNYMLGIQWSDDYRLKLIQDPGAGKPVSQAESQTNVIAAYTIHHQPWFTVPYTLTIIDTPGFGDTGGIKRDQEITDQIRQFFMTKGNGGIDHLDAVGFVVQSALPRLTKIQRYIFDSILAVFGKDIAQNIFMLLTFADGQKPQVLAGLKEAKMQYQNFYKFNNSALFVGGSRKTIDAQDESDEDSDSDSSDEEDGGTAFDQMFWKMGAGNFTKFMIDLESVEPQSLALTAEVLQERSVLEMTTNSIQEHIKLGLKKLEQLKMEQDLLKHHESDIQKNKNFEYEVPESYFNAVLLPKGKKALNCQNCRYTCHQPCTKKYAYMCKVMSRLGYCYMCPGRCSSSYHEFSAFRYEIKTVIVTKTSNDLKRRYEEAAGKKLTTEQLIAMFNEEFDEVQAATLDLAEQAQKCLARLEEIALKPNPLSTTDYIDLMIQEEEFMKEPGWKETVKQLKEVKKRASSLQQLAIANYDPFGKSKGKSKAKAKSPEPGKSNYVAKLYKDLKEEPKGQK